MLSRLNPDDEGPLNDISTSDHNEYVPANPPEFGRLFIDGSGFSSVNLGEIVGFLSCAALPVVFDPDSCSNLISREVIKLLIKNIIAATTKKQIRSTKIMRGNVNVLNRKHASLVDQHSRLIKLLFPPMGKMWSGNRSLFAFKWISGIR